MELPTARAQTLPVIIADKGKQVPPKVSLIVTSHNQIEYSKVMYASLREHTRYPFELVWVDCISTDGTREWLNSEIHKDTMKVFIPKMGIGEAMNIGFSKCSADSEYIGDLDNDLILTDGWLTRLINHVERDKKIAACQPLWQQNINYLWRVDKAYTFRKRFLKYLTEFYKKKLEAFLWRKVKKLLIKNPNRIHSIAQEIKDREGVKIVWWVNGSHTLYRRSALEQVGLWNPVFWMGEDKDIGIRLSTAGWKSAIALNTCIYHFQGKTTDRIDKTDPEWRKHRTESKLRLEELYGMRMRLECINQDELEKEALWEKARSRWRQSKPDNALTWNVTVSGDDFVRKANSYGVFSRNKNLLEVGVGGGRILKSLINLGIPYKKYVGIDISQASVDYLRENFSEDKLEFIHGDVELYQFQEMFDIILSSLTFKHLYPTFEKALLNISMYMNPNAVIFFDIIEGDSPYFEHDGVTYIGKYSKAEVMDIMRSCCLELISFDQIKHIPTKKPNRYRVRLLVVGEKS